jgi:hypothetical protein
MSYVWKNCKEKGSRKLMLLAIADNANDDGFAYPSVETLAQKTCMTERNAQKTVDYLEEKGFVRVFNRTAEDGSEQCYSNLYQVFMGVEKAVPQDIRGKKKERLSSRGRVSWATGEGVVGDSGRVSPVTSESSLEPSVESSEKESPIIPKNKKSLKQKGEEIDDLNQAISEFKQIPATRPSVKSLAFLLKGGKNGKKDLQEMEYPATGDEFRAFVYWMEVSHKYTDLKTFAADHTWIAWFNRFRDDKIRHDNAIKLVIERRKQSSVEGNSRLVIPSGSDTIQNTTDPNAKVQQVARYEEIFDSSEDKLAWFLNTTNTTKPDG